MENEKLIVSVEVDIAHLSRSGKFYLQSCVADGESHGHKFSIGCTLGTMEPVVTIDGEATVHFPALSLVHAALEAVEKEAGNE